MKIALAQINTTVGDIPGNLRLIRDFARRGETLGADLVVFPEHSVGGYPALDLWESPGFARANLSAVRSLARSVRDTGILLGFVSPNERATGKPAHNSAALLFRGKVRALRHKSLLPSYDVFDEARYFEPARENLPIRFKGRRLGVSICEDAWYRAFPRPLYPHDPIASQVKAGAEILINLSASPYERGKTGFRKKLYAEHARRTGRPFLIANLVGGNDELIFDGRSLALDHRGHLAARARSFEEDLIIVDPDSPRTATSPAPQGAGEVAEALSLGLRDYTRKCGFDKVFVGLSGGIDSALVAALAVKALGRSKVTGVSMPSPYSSRGSRDDAKSLAKNLGIRYLEIPISGIFRAYLKTLRPQFKGAKPDTAEQNIQARIRGNILMALSNKEGGLVLSTGNKSEVSVGYCTLYGDMCGGLSVIADVPKTLVYEIARWFNRSRTVIPKSTLTKAPSAELKYHQKDQDDLPPYSTLDKILNLYIEERLEKNDLLRRSRSPKMVMDILRRVDRSEYKRRQAAPSLKITSKAYGAGRRMPIARKDY